MVGVDVHPATQRTTSPVISVLIVNFRSTDLLETCLDALQQSTIAERLEIIVVDNASPGFNADDLRRRHAHVQFLPQATNTTYTGGNNLAFERATGDYVLLLNPDTRVEPPALARALAHFEANSRLVAQGAYLLDDSGRLQRYYRRLPRPIDVPVVLLERLFRRTGLGRRYVMADETFTGSTFVEQPPGAFLMVRREHCPQPILDPAYYNFFSDVELCDRLSRAGVIAVSDDVRCAHGRGLAGVKTSDFRDQLRLYQDLTWGVRHYFRPRMGLAGMAYVEAWLLLFWLLRGGQAVARRPRSVPRALAVALASLRGKAPSYE